MIWENARINESTSRLLVLLTCMTLGGCEASSGWRWTEPEEPPVVVEQPPVVLRVTGYGAYDLEAAKKSGQVRLDAVRVSRLDAYRALAERVYGTRVVSTTEIDRLKIKQDRLVASVDSSIRGAQVVAINEMQPGTIETVLELVLDNSFHQCLIDASPVRDNAACRIPFPRRDDLDNGAISPDRELAGADLRIEPMPMTTNPAPQEAAASSAGKGAQGGTLYYLK